MRVTDNPLTSWWGSASDQAASSQGSPKSQVLRQAFTMNGPRAQYVSRMDAARSYLLDELRQTDVETRSRTRAQARATFGAAKYVDVRGPDLGLYAVDGPVIGGVKGARTAGRSAVSLVSLTPTIGTRADVTA